MRIRTDHEGPLTGEAFFAAGPESAIFWAGSISEDGLFSNQLLVKDLYDKMKGNRNGKSAFHA